MEDLTTAVSEFTVSIDTIWILVAAALVMFMQPGFALVEAGFTRSKNTANILMKNLMDFAIGSLIFWILGYTLMYGEDVGGFIGKISLFFGSNEINGVPDKASLMFQTVFAATAATIVSGAVAERTKFSAYIAFSIAITAVIYPISGHWVWGGGWLSSMATPFHDFAGSTVVHSVGAWVGLAGAVVIGPRLGKYTSEGKARAIPGQNLAFGALGVFILWFGWFGFNAGSALAAGGLSTSAFVVTHMAASAAMLSWMFAEWMHRGKPTVLGAASGAVAGLVAITPAAGFVSPVSSIAVGGVAGALCYGAVMMKAKVGYDDSLDVVGVHGVGGTWGALATGLFASTAINAGGGNGLFFGNPQLLALQAGAVGATAVYAFVVTWVLFKILDKAMGLRVADEDEVMGLDLTQHGEAGYNW